jgi:bacterioferritin
METTMSKEEFIKGLNQDLAGEWGAVVRYTYQAGKSVGVLGVELYEMFHAEALDEIGHATYLTDVIIDLGGEPTTTPKEFDKPSNIKAMLELDLKIEEEDMANYKKRAEQADKLGLIDIKVKLEEIAADEGGHARKLRRLLKGM